MEKSKWANRRASPENGDARLMKSCSCGLELQAQAKLHDARTAAAEARIALRHVWRLRDQAGAGAAGRDDVRRQSKVRVVENVEEFRAELELQPFANLEKFLVVEKS